MRVNRVIPNKYDESHGHTITLDSPDIVRILEVLMSYPTAIYIDGHIECWDWNTILKIAGELDSSYV